MDKDQKSKVSANSPDKRKNAGPIRREKTSKLNRLDEARALAERLRNYKSDLQKMKKEKAFAFIPLASPLSCLICTCLA